MLKTMINSAKSYALEPTDIVYLVELYIAGHGGEGEAMRMVELAGKITMCDDYSEAGELIELQNRTGIFLIEELRPKKPVGMLPLSWDAAKMLYAENVKSATLEGVPHSVVSFLKPS